MQTVLTCSCCAHWRSGHCATILHRFDEGLNARALPAGGALVEGGDEVAGDESLLLTAPDFGCRLWEPKVRAGARD